MSPSTATSLRERAVAREQTRAQRRRRILARVLLAALLAGLLLATAGWLLLRSSVFALDRVVVTGLERLGPAQVQQQAAVRPGTPLVRVDTDAVAARVARLPAVRTVAVDRDWPGTLRVAVRERTPVAVRAVGSSWALVDRSGVVFDTVDRRPRRLPVVSAPVDEGPAALLATLDVLDALPLPVREQVRDVRAATPDSVTVRLSRDRTVVWGSSERAQRKAAVLAVLLTRKARVYDVSAPDTPTTRR